VRGTVAVVPGWVEDEEGVEEGVEVVVVVELVGLEQAASKDVMMSMKINKPNRDFFCIFPPFIISITKRFIRL